MKIHRMLLPWMMVLGLSANTGAGSPEARFEWERPLDGTFEVGQRGRLLITDDVFGESRDFPDDLRIFDSKGTQWPCFLFVPRETVVTKSIGVEILNKAWVYGPEPYLQFDIVIPEIDGTTATHNRLELITTGRAFVRRVEIRTGDESAGLMASGYLIEFSARHDARNRIIRYPDSDADRLHVRIYPNAQSAGETFEISGAYLRHQSEKEEEREPVSFVELPVDAGEQNDDAQTHLLDVGEPNRPVESIQFNVQNLSYARCVSLYGRNSDHEPWRRVGGGEIHALPDDQNDSIRLNARYRFLKAEIYHYDDQPLEIASIRLTAAPRYLVFEAASRGTAALYFRAWDIAPARYDLKSRMDTETIESLPMVGTLERRPNSLARLQPWRRYSKLLAALAVGAVSLLVIWIIIGMIRQAPPEEPS